MPRLVINPGTAHQWEATLKAGTNTVGRSAACDVQIQHESVSGTHCEITVAGSNVRLRDLGSTNGSFLNRAPIQEAALGPGQRLQLGGVEVELLPDAAPPPPGPPGSAASPAFGALRIAAPVAGAVAPAAPAAPAAVPMASSAGPPGPPPPIPPRASLRVTVHEAPPPPPSAPAAYVPDEYATDLAAPPMCKHHPKSYARFLCPQCQLHYCELCVTTRPGGTRTGRFCRRCSGECVAMNVPILPVRNPHENFFASVPGAFVYPFKGIAGNIFLFGGAIVFAALEVVLGISILRGLLFKISLLGYVFAYMQKIIHIAALGEDEPPGWPDVSEFVQDLLMPGLQFLGTLAVSFGPSMALSFWVATEVAAGGSPDPMKALLVVGAMALGVVYFPMALLAVAMHDSIAAVNPILVVVSMLKVPLEYLVTLVLMAAAIGAWALGLWLWPLLPWPVITTVVSKWFSLYLLSVLMRLLGLMYYAKRHKLGWLQG